MTLFAMKDRKTGQGITETPGGTWWFHYGGCLGDKMYNSWEELVSDNILWILRRIGELGSELSFLSKLSGKMVPK